jgi:hypothetical protein
VSATEFAFLAFGLVLGVASGVALAVVVRARPSAPREVRVTVAPDSLARRRPATLASADHRDHSAAAIGVEAEVETDDRTSVRDAPASLTPMISGPPGTPAAARPTLPDTAVGIPIETDPPSAPFSLPVPVAAGRPARATADDAPRPARGAASSSASRSTADTPRAAGGDGGGTDAASPSPAPPSPAPAAPVPAIDPTGPCAEVRQAAEERCAIAKRTRDHAQEAADALVQARRTYDAHRTRAEEAERLLDPRAVREAKDAAQRAFRSSRGGTTDTEAAARDWLHEINRINTTAREAQKTVDKERQTLLTLVPQLDRLELQADAARIAAESAEVACRDARDAVARCDEETTRAAASSAAAAPPPASSWAPTGPADLAAPLGSGQRGGAMAIGAGGPPAILRLLRGDRQLLERIVAALGGADPVERRSWQRRITDLVDAIVARAIEAAYLDFPDDHRFWGPFTRSQCRDIVAALASLGYRFDGLGGWLDERVPSQRDLSLAMGYAGLDPMRIRHWPVDAEMESLFRTAFVSADEWLAGAAGELTLGEMVDALGRRADDLTDVWNEWGRVRPLLLETE